MFGKSQLCNVQVSDTRGVFMTSPNIVLDWSPGQTLHDALQTQISTSTRSDIGFVTSAGRIIRVHAGDIPAGSADAFGSSSIAAHSFLGLSADEQILTAIELSESVELAVATKLGVVKRIIADYPAKDDFEIINLKDGDRLVGAAQCSDNDRMVFIASDSQLLTFDASSVRPQGRAAGGVAGINLDESANLIFFGVIAAAQLDTAMVVTAACSSQALPGTDAGSAKLSALSEFPTKGRATGGVRSHKFLKGEDVLYFAWAGSDTPKLATKDGKPITANLEPAKRDASGEKQSSVIASAGI